LLSGFAATTEQARFERATAAAARLKLNHLFALLAPISLTPARAGASVHGFDIYITE
jgi:hypothetical protein